MNACRVHFQLLFALLTSSVGRLFGLRKMPVGPMSLGLSAYRGQGLSD